MEWRRVLLMVWAGLLALPAMGDEVDELAAQVKPPARFADHVPALRAEQRTFTFNQAKGPEQKTWTVVLDGDKYVALVRSGDFNLLALTPADARTKLDMPTGRYHLDTQLGPTLATHQFLQPVKTHGAIYNEAQAKPVDEWIGGGKTLTLVRRMKSDVQVTEHRFAISVDPVFGYRIDGHYDVRFKEMPQGVKWGGPTFTPGCYVPWPEDRVYDRTVHCPEAGGYRGWANNLVCMDRADADRKACTWRDGSFIAHLSKRDGWSVVRTRQDGGGAVSMPVCNAHNDFHVNIPLPAELPKDEKGWFHFTATHRLMGLPPEMTTHIWDRMQLIQKDAKDVIIAVGEMEDFEDQPKSLAKPHRGLAWTSNSPKISRDEAHSGKQSLYLTGTSWPNLPQVSCRPNARYRVEAWYKLVPWTDEEKAAAKAKDAAQREKLKAAGKPLPPEIDWDNATAEAYITAHMYEWSPYSSEWLVKQETTRARADRQGWQKVELEFDTPAWDPFVNIVFVVNNGKAYLDDFALVRIDRP